MESGTIAPFSTQMALIRCSQKAIVKVSKGRRTESPRVLAIQILKESRLSSWMTIMAKMMKAQLCFLLMSVAIEFEPNLDSSHSKIK